ncbi:hypothetical protein XENTR_v10014385 [Xenopus tropicalis]|nr:hypothetical protein XENTR_v10014385 [Xenopus tropicalis]
MFPAGPLWVILLIFLCSGLGGSFSLEGNCAFKHVICCHWKKDLCNRKGCCCDEFCKTEIHCSSNNRKPCHTVKYCTYMDTF